MYFMDKFGKCNDKISRLIEITLIFIISLSVGFLFGTSDYLNEDNCNYAVEEIHEYNHQIFDGNINTVGASVSPRHYANVTMAYIMRLLDGSWFESSALLIRINYILYAILITYMTMKFLKKDRLLGSLIFTVCVMSGNSMISLAFGLNGASDVFLGTGYCIAFMALVCVAGEKKNWSVSWILATIAAFMHVHEGMWVGCVIGVIWFAQCIANKKINWQSLKLLPLYVFSLLIIVMPSLMSTEAVDEAYFNQIYVFIRTPHHLLVSSWGWKQVLTSIFLLLVIPACVLILDYRENRQEKRIEKIIYSVVLLSVLYIFLLIAQYLATEVYSISTLVTMYVPKCFKFMTFLAIILYVALGFRYIEKEKFFRGIFLLLIVLLPVGSNKFYFAIAIVCFVLFYIDVKFDLESKIINISEYNQAKIIVRISLYLFLFLLSNRYLERLNSKIIFLYVAIILYEFIIHALKKKYFVIIASSFLLVLTLAYSLDNRVFDISKSGVNYITGIDYARKGINWDVYELAIQYKEATDISADFLADPDSHESNYFQLFSQRNCYCLYKNVPSNKNLVIKWYERIENVRKMTTCTSEELAELMNEIDIEYVLVTSDRYPELERSKLFEKIARNDSLGIYTLVR